MTSILLNFKVLPEASSSALFTFRGCLCGWTSGTEDVACVQTEGLKGLILFYIKWVKYNVYGTWWWMLAVGWWRCDIISHVYLKKLQAKGFIGWKGYWWGSALVRRVRDSRFGHQVEPERKVMNRLGVDEVGGASDGRAANRTRLS